MTDLRSAAQQALEALEFMADEWGFTNKANRPERWQAIDALRAALEQPEQAEPVAWMVYTQDGKSVCVTDNPADFIEWRSFPLFTYPPHQEATPQVVYRLGETDIYDFAGWLTTRPGVMRVGSSCEAGPMAEAVGEYLRTYPERFTANPPRREWRGLKEWEINDGREQLPSEDLCNWSFRQGVYFAEKALKERNA